MEVLFESHSDFHDITVQDRDGIRELRFGGRLQSAVDAETLTVSRAPILDYLHLPVAFVPRARRVLVVGLGGGVLPKRMHRDYSQMQIDVVELDPVIVQVARDFFALPEDERLRVIVGDGREYLRSTSEAYDIIIVDAFFETRVPFALVTREFFEILKARLQPRGVVAFNLVGALEGADSEPFLRVLAGLREAFADVRLFTVSPSLNRDAGRSNFVAVGSDTVRATEAIKASIRGRAGGQVTVPSFEHWDEELFEMPAPRDVVEPLTDEEAPVDGLLRT